jgi:hypothetical protein
VECRIPLRQLKSLGSLAPRADISNSRLIRGVIIESCGSFHNNSISEPALPQHVRQCPADTDRTERDRVPSKHRAHVEMATVSAVRTRQNWLVCGTLASHAGRGASGILNHRDCKQRKPFPPCRALRQDARALRLYGAGVSS